MLGDGKGQRSKDRVPNVMSYKFNKKVVAVYLIEAGFLN
jgi:hypothetical protein